MDVVGRAEHGRPLFVVGLGGSTRDGSSTQTVVQAVLRHVEEAGGRTELFAGEDLVLPMYERTPDCTAASSRLIDAVRRADAVVIGSPGYHGTISGLMKNVLDHLEQLSQDDPPYLDGKAVGCIATAAGWQGAASTLQTLRQAVHAMRGWPTPYGIAANVIGGLVGEDGTFLDDQLRVGAKLMAHQIIEFSRAMRVTAAVGAAR
jgi:FMN reductase